MKMIVLFGPQGSGNHLFGKIFSMHESVHGWKEALNPDGYFIPHYKEPFNYYWNKFNNNYSQKKDVLTTLPAKLRIIKLPRH